MRTEIVQTIAAGDTIVDGMGKGGIASTGLGLFGVITTANLQYYGLVAGGAAVLAIQIWWEWYRQSRRARIEAEEAESKARIDCEAYKARARKKLADEGIDTANMPVFNPSPDPDSVTDP
ncbi:MAG: hypothetical protein U0790_25205 [Isosphaeraceae bacterium]